MSGANWWRAIGSWCGCIPGLSDEAARYKNEIHALLQVLFPEFSQVFADPCRPTALAVLEGYRSRPGRRFGWG